MPSLVDGFEYDIFISYRQNDNKYDGWVSEFVAKLQQELQATLKDKLTIFFDENPQDGLLETHQVDSSISSKIKSLLFIPIISQTYCDTSSFAWQQEFVVFKNESDKDELGRNIRLQNGNFGSRILPIKIHEIDINDTRLLENELSGNLRSIDFIYRDAGVNRPLRHVDDELIVNSSQLLYRNQINKLANAIKELITGIKMVVKGESVPISNQNVTISESEPNSLKSFDSTLPGGLKVAVINQSSPNIFLAWTSNDLKEKRDEMALILQKAGFNVFPSTDCPADDDQFKSKVTEEISKCSCSLHLMSGEFGRRFEIDDDKSFPQYQFEQAKELSQQNSSDFNTFIWYNQESDRPVKPAQQALIKNIRNSITANMMFSNSFSPMALVDDIRAITMKPVDELLDTADTDIFFIFSQQDESDAMEITDRISTEYPVEIMNILPDGETEYRLKSTQQIPKSKLAVIYFKYAADWALPFIKQVWKQVGGASSPTPLLLVGEDEPHSNLSRYFKAPKVVTSIVPKDNVPEEIKKVYVSALELK